MIQQLFTDPDAFFEERAKLGGFKKSGSVVLLAALAFTLQTFAVWILIGDRFRDVFTAGTFSFVADFLTPFALWLLLSFGFYVIAVALGGRPDIGRMIRLSGWGFAPVVLTGVFWGAGRYLSLGGSTFPPKGGPMGVPIPDQFEMLDAFISKAHGDPTYVGGIALGVLGFVVAIYLWTYAVKHSSELDRNKSLVAAAVPTLVYLVWQVPKLL